MMRDLIGILPKQNEKVSLKNRHCGMTGVCCDPIRGRGKRGGFWMEVGSCMFMYLILSHLSSSFYRFQIIARAEVL